MNSKISAMNATYLFCVGCEGCLINGVARESCIDTISSPSTYLADGAAKKKVTQFTIVREKESLYTVRNRNKRDDTSH